VPEVRICRTTLARSDAGAYVQSPVPDAGSRRKLRHDGLASLRTLAAPALARHFEDFCDALDHAASSTSDLAACMTAARRVYERPAGTDYLELAVSAQARSDAYLTFAARLLLDAAVFREHMNGALGEYRRRTGTRSNAQPFPDLAADDGRVEAPFWVLRDGVRRTASIDARGVLYADDARVADIGTSAELAIERLRAEDVLLAPKALTLTMFERLFVADLFVHGTGEGATTA
jgi:hypothetical protein